MLQVIFTYDGEQPIFETLRSVGFKYDNGIYVLANTNIKDRVTITHLSEKKQLHMQFSKELSFEEYKRLHSIISTISTKLGCGINDDDAMMGYLEDGSEAFIYHGWKQWVLFLEGAKHTSMEGQKVKIYIGQLLLGEGILVDTMKEIEHGELKVKSCTLITQNGEQTFKGEQLTIIPTKEF